MATITTYVGYGTGVWGRGGYGESLVEAAIDGASATGATGSVAGGHVVAIAVTGVSATGSVGTLATSASVALSGVLGTSYTGVFVIPWTPAVPGQNPNWQGVNETQTPAWLVVDNTQTPGWISVT